MPNILIKKLYFCTLIIISIIIAHILTIIYLAYFSSNKTYIHLTNKYELHKFSEIQNNEENLKNKNSAFQYYICPFNIRHKTLYVSIKNNGIDFWNLAFYNSKGHLVYSLNNQLIHHKNLNLILGEPMELALLKKYYNNQDLASYTIIPRNIEKGISVLKIYANSLNEKKQAQDLAQNASCKALM